MLEFEKSRVMFEFLVIVCSRPKPVFTQLHEKTMAHKTQQWKELTVNAHSVLLVYDTTMHSK
jgi:hypothetical protein